MQQRSLLFGLTISILGAPAFGFPIAEQRSFDQLSKSAALSVVYSPANENDIDMRDC